MTKMNAEHAESNVWDALTPQYDAWYDTPLGAFVLQVEVGALAELAGQLSGASGLEVGCGTGRFGRALTQLGARMIGIDLSRAILDAGRENRQGTLSLCQADGGRLPFWASSFDLVLAVTLLEFVPDPNKVLAEMWRVLRPEGRLLIGALNAWNPWALMRKRSGQKPFASAHFFSPPEFRELLARFGRVTWRGAVFLPPWIEVYQRAFWERVERLGAGNAPWFGAFLAGCVRKQAGA